MFCLVKAKEPTVLMRGNKGVAEEFTIVRSQKKKWLRGQTLPAILAKCSTEKLSSWEARLVPVIQSHFYKPKSNKIHQISSTKQHPWNYREGLLSQQLSPGLFIPPNTEASLNQDPSLASWSVELVSSSTSHRNSRLNVAYLISWLTSFHI